MRKALVTGCVLLLAMLGMAWATGLIRTATPRPIALSAPARPMAPVRIAPPPLAVAPPVQAADIDRAVLAPFAVSRKKPVRSAERYGRRHHRTVIAPRVSPARAELAAVRPAAPLPQIGPPEPAPLPVEDAARPGTAAGEVSAPPTALPKTMAARPA